MINLNYPIPKVIKDIISGSKNNYERYAKLIDLYNQIAYRYDFLLIKCLKENQLKKDLTVINFLNKLTKENFFSILGDNDFASNAYESAKRLSKLVHQNIIIYRNNNRKSIPFDIFNILSLNKDNSKNCYIEILNYILNMGERKSFDTLINDDKKQGYIKSLKFIINFDNQFFKDFVTIENKDAVIELKSCAMRCVEQIQNASIRKTLIKQLNVKHIPKNLQGIFIHSTDYEYFNLRLNNLITKIHSRYKNIEYDEIDPLQLELDRDTLNYLETLSNEELTTLTGCKIYMEKIRSLTSRCSYLIEIAWQEYGNCPMQLLDKLRNDEFLTEEEYNTIEYNTLINKDFSKELNEILDEKLGKQSKQTKAKKSNKSQEKPKNVESEQA